MRPRMAGFKRPLTVPTHREASDIAAGQGWLLAWEVVEEVTCTIAGLLAWEVIETPICPIAWQFAGDWL